MAVNLTCVGEVSTWNAYLEVPRGKVWAAFYRFELKRQRVVTSTAKVSSPGLIGVSA